MCKRVLLYGLQSSGATTLAMLLAQREGASAVLDLFHGRMLPLNVTLPELCVVKATIPAVNAESHLATLSTRIQADKVLLVVRNPWCNYSSLKNKAYGQDIIHKFVSLNRLWKGREQCDGVLCFEDLFFDNTRLLTELSFWPLPSNALEFPKKVPDVVRITLANGGWPAQTFRRKWGIGNLHERVRFRLNPSYLCKSIDPANWQLVRNSAPDLVIWYEEQQREYLEIGGIR